MNLALKLAALGMDMEGVPEQSFLELKGRTKHNLLENVHLSAHHGTRENLFGSGPSLGLHSLNGYHPLNGWLHSVYRLCTYAVN